MQNILEIKSDLQKKFSKVSEDYELLKKEHSTKFLTVEKDLDEYKKKCKILERSSSDYAEENTVLKNQLHDLRELLVKKEADITELIESIKNDDTEKINLELREKVQHLTEQVESLGGSRKKLSESSSGNDEFIVLQGSGDEDSRVNSPKVFEDKILELESKVAFVEAENSKYAAQIEELDNLKIQVTKTEAEKAELKVELAELRENISSLEKNIESNLLGLREIEGLRKNTEEQKNALQIEIDELRNVKLKKLIDQNEKLEKSLSSQSDKVIDSQSEQKILQNELNERINQINFENESSIKKLTNSHNAIENKLKSKISELTLQNQELNNVIKEFKNTENSLTLKISEMNSENEKLSTELSKINDNASQVESNLMMENVDLQRKSNDLHEKIKLFFSKYTKIQLAEGNSSLEEAFKSLRDKLGIVEVLEKNLREMSNEINILQDSKIQWDHQRETLEADIGHYESECSELMKNNEILLNELENYKQNKLETIPENDEDNIVDLECQLEECTNLNRTLEEEYRELNEKISQLESDKLDTLNELKSAQNLNAELSEKVENFKQVVENLESEKCNLVFEVNELKTYDEKKLNDSAVQDYRITIEKLEKQLADNSAEIKTLKEAIENEKTKLSESQNALSGETAKLEDLKNSFEIEATKFKTTIQEYQFKIAKFDSKISDEESTSKLLECQLECEQLKKTLSEQENTIAEFENIKIEKDHLNSQLEKLQKLETENSQSQLDLQKSLNTLNFEKNELIKTLQSKHSENMQYYMEIQRLTQLLQTAESADKPQILEMCENCKRLEKVIEEASLETEKLKDQINFLREKSDILTSNLMSEQTNQKVLQQEIAEISSQKVGLEKDLQRLREHLVVVEDAHTQDSIEMQNMLDAANAKMTALEDNVSKSSTAYTSASIRANQHAETLQAQYTLVTQQRDELVTKLSVAEDRESKNQAALINLQCALEQFQNDKENDIQSATQKIRKEMVAEKNKQTDLLAEIAALNQQLVDANHGLLAASRISDQLETSQMKMTSLREEMDELKLIKLKLEEKLKTTESSQSDKIEKNLVKSLLIGYIVSSGANDKNQILKMISNLLDFTQTESDKVGLNKQQSGWFGSLAPALPGTQTKDNLVQAFVNFLEQESQPPQANLPNLLSTTTTSPRKNSNASTSTMPVQPILLNENVLENFAPSRNSSSILKDILNDS